MTQSLPSTSTSLLLRAAAQQTEAWQRLAEIYGPLVYGWCRQAGLQPEDAADVSQETFATVAVKLSGFRRERADDTFRGWLWTVNRNKIRDHFRRLQKQAEGRGGTDAQDELAQIPESVEDDSSAMASASGADGVERRALEIVRAGVEPRTWQAFWRVAVDGLSAVDVAAELGISVQAVYDAKYRISRRMRQEFGDLLD